VKKICTNLRPGLLDDLGLSAAIEWLANQFKERTGIQIDLSIEFENSSLDMQFSTAVFRVAQEALTNIIRHARATKVEVTLEYLDGDMILKVQDNGIGFNETEIVDYQKFGLIGMRERILSFGGTFKLTGSTGEGTTLHAYFPAIGFEDQK
jgi:signal transduction histidine kinase